MSLIYFTGTGILFSDKLCVRIWVMSVWMCERESPSEFCGKNEKFLSDVSISYELRSGIRLIRRKILSLLRLYKVVIQRFQYLQTIKHVKWCKTNRTIQQHYNRYDKLSLTCIRNQNSFLKKIWILAVHEISAAKKKMKESTVKRMKKKKIIHLRWTIKLV